MRELYEVSRNTWWKWEKSVPNLGEYRGREYTPHQIKLIVNHLGPPAKSSDRLTRILSAA